MPLKVQLLYSPRYNPFKVLPYPFSASIFRMRVMCASFIARALSESCDASRPV
jgi:hypothetical protein